MIKSLKGKRDFKALSKKVQKQVIQVINANPLQIKGAMQDRKPERSPRQQREAATAKRRRPLPEIPKKAPTPPPRKDLEGPPLPPLPPYNPDLGD